MKITERHLRRIVRGSLSEVAPPTVGAVLDAIEAVQGVEGKAAKKEKMKAVAKKVGWEAVKFIPIVGKPVAGIKKLSDLYKTAKGTPGSAVVKDDVVLDMIQIDPEYQRMLDDDLEDKFDEFAIDKLNSLPRDAPLPDMTAALEKWVKKNFDERGIEGAVTENRIRITKHQLRRIIREAEGSTKKYDDDSALRGKQSTLPDSLQRGIIDKTVEDREEREEEVREEKNESVRTTRRRLRRITREAMGPLPTDLVRQTQWPAEKDPLTALRDGLIELGPDAEGLFSMLVLDLGSSPQEVAENIPELASVLRGTDQQTLLDVANSL